MSRIADNARTTGWPFRFSLASVLLAMAVISMCLAVGRVHLGTGLLVSFLTVPALIRTALVANREGQSGKPLSAVAKILEFLFSWMLMLPIGLAALIIGGAACTLVSIGTYTVLEMCVLILPSSPSLGLILKTYFFCTSLTAAVGSTGIFLTLGIRSSLQYRPVARI